MLSGLPASGKSTLAKQICEESGNTIRLNRDLLRKMLHNDKWTPRNESVTVDMEKLLAMALLTDNKNVVIDDTNLGQSHKDMWRNVARETNSSFEHISIDTSWEECCERDSARLDSVGKHVIKNMALKYGLVGEPKIGYVLCDIDGTLADITHRKHFVEGDKKDWKSFFEAMDKDTVRYEIAGQLIDFYNKGYTCILVSGRPEDYREVTEWWLSEYNLGFPFTLLMRGKNDTRPDDIVKEDILNTYFPDKSLIKYVIDDRPRVIRMWRKNGLSVIDVGDGVEF